MTFSLSIPRLFCAPNSPEISLARQNLEKMIGVYSISPKRVNESELRHLIGFLEQHLNEFDPIRSNDGKYSEILRLKARALTLLGCINYTSTSTKAAESIFLQILKMFPEFSLDGSIASLEEAMFFESLKTSRQGQITIRSTPGQAKIYINDRYWGDTPLINQSIVAGLHRLTVEKSGYTKYSQPIEIRSNSSHSIHAKLERNTGTIYVATNPGGASVYLDGVYRGMTPASSIQTNLNDKTTNHLKISNLSLGSHSIEYRLLCHEPVARTFRIEPGDWVFETIHLEKGYGILRITSDSETPVILDDILVGTTPLQVNDLCTGHHQIQARTGTSDGWFENIVIHSGKVLEIKIHPRPTLVFLGDMRRDVSDDGFACKIFDDLNQLETMNLIREKHDFSELSPLKTIRDLLTKNPPDSIENHVFTQIAPAITEICRAHSASMTALIFPDSNNQLSLWLFHRQIIQPEKITFASKSKSDLSLILRQLFRSPTHLQCLDPGMVISDHRNQVVVSAILPRGPASSAGLHPGDIILQVNGVKTDDTRSFYRQIQEQSDSILNLKISRNQETLEMEIMPRKSPLLIPLHDSNRLYLLNLATYRQFEDVSNSVYQSALINKGICYLTLGLYEKALSEALMKCELPDGSGVSLGTLLFYRAFAFEQLGKYSNARRNYSIAAQKPLARFLSPWGPRVAPMALLKLNHMEHR